MAVETDHGEKSKWFARFTHLKQTFKRIEAVTKWPRLLFGVASGLISVFSFLSPFFAPDFYAEYRFDRDTVVPVAALLRGFGREGDASGIPAEARILHVRIVNDGGKSTVKDTKLTIEGGIQQLYFVIDDSGNRMNSSPKSPSEGISRLDVNVGDLYPSSQAELFIGGKFSEFFDPLIEVRSSNRGLARVREAGEVSGTKRFVAENLEWIAGLAFLSLAVLFVAISRRK